MSVVTGDVVTDVFTTSAPTTGAAADADSLPTGTLYLDGVANGATVTVADLTGTGRYSWSATMPTLTSGQRVRVVIAATIGGLACGGDVWADFAETRQTGDSFARIGALGAGLSGIPWNAAWDAEVQSEAADALVAYGASTSTEVTAIQNNTRVVRVVPTVIERPDSGTTTYRVELLLYDAVGNMEAPDSAPTIALVNQAGTDLSARLDSPTMALVSTGRYRAIYTASVGDTLEQLVWAFSVVEGGATRVYGNTSLIVDTTAVDFTAADRVVLNAAATATGLTSTQAALAAAIAALNDLSSAQAQAAALAANVAYDATVPADLAGLSTLTASQVWAAITAAAANIIADHVIRRGAAAAFASANGDALPDAANLLGVIMRGVHADTTTNPGFLTVFDPAGGELAQISLTPDAAADPTVALG